MSLFSCFSGPLLLLEQVVTACGGKKKKKMMMMKGTVVLMKRDVLGYSDFDSSSINFTREAVDEFLGKTISLQLITAVNGDPGKLGSVAYLEDCITTDAQTNVGESAFSLSFEREEEMGIPGAFLIKNFHHHEFYLKTFTLEHVPGQHPIVFLCNSWVYPAKNYTNPRVFFSNKSYRPDETPPPLIRYRNDELANLRGDGTGELKEWERVYDYAYYNDLGNPDRDSDHVRPVLGGSSEYPYPRRGRTGRPPSKTDPKCEIRINVVNSLNIYVPRDERFGHLKMSDFVAYALKSVAQVLHPEFKSLSIGGIKNEYDSLEDMLKLYEDDATKASSENFLKSIAENTHSEVLHELLRSDGENLPKLPTPQVIKANKSVWSTDEEFTREMLAGLNPVIIRRLGEFPPKSRLNPEIYGKQDSTITREQVENRLDGLTIEQAIEANRLFILDHHDTIMPYIRRINTTSTKIYASRTLLFLQEDGTLKPLAIELSLPSSKGDEFGATSDVYTPSEDGVQGSLWKLAKTYVIVNDSGIHQLISHWLNTHAVIEPFVIATNRQLSVVHPIHKLLHPHFRDTMNINALARQVLINAGGLLETTVFPGKYAMEMSAVLYKGWVFPEQALPADLIKRGMAVEDSSAPHGLRLLIQDYPFAVDGLKIWSAIKTWVDDYCNFYYRTDEILQKDGELQTWWKELREQGHGDKKDEPWWPKMQTRQELIDSCTIIIWVASALHAAVNFGQYSYGGYLPNRPTISRRFMPEPGSPEYEELKSSPDKVLLKTIPDQLQGLLGISLIEILSRHASDEVYLGQTENPEWTNDTKPLEAFENFRKKLSEIEEEIEELNKNPELKNRAGLVNVPYTLLIPSSEPGLTGKGVPNSVSI